MPTLTLKLLTGQRYRLIPPSKRSDVAALAPNGPGRNLGQANARLREEHKRASPYGRLRPSRASTA